MLENTQYALSKYVNGIQFNSLIKKQFGFYQSVSCLPNEVFMVDFLLCGLTIVVFRGLKVM